MNMRAHIGFPLVLAVLSCGLSASDKDLPEAVKKAFAEKYAGASIRKSEAETDEGATTYAIKFKDTAGNKGEADFAADGTFISEERRISTSDLPAAVSAAVLAKYPNAKIEKAKAVTEDGVQTYAIEIETADENDVELEVSADGTKVEAEDEDGDDDGDEDGDDDDDDDDKDDDAK